MARDLWPHEQDLWPEINLGTILGCGALSTPAINEREPNERENENERRNTPQQPRGTTRLLQILYPNQPTSYGSSNVRESLGIQIIDTTKERSQHVG